MTTWSIIYLYLFVKCRRTRLNESKTYEEVNVPYKKKRKLSRQILHLNLTLVRELDWNLFWNLCMSLNPWRLSRTDRLLDSVSWTHATQAYSRISSKTLPEIQHYAKNTRHFILHKNIMRLFSFWVVNNLCYYLLFFIKLFHK